MQGILQRLRTTRRKQQDGRRKVDPHQQHHQRARRPVGRHHSGGGQVPGQQLLAHREQRGPHHGAHHQVAQRRLGARADAHEPHKQRHSQAKGNGFVDELQQRRQGRQNRQVACGQMLPGPARQQVDQGGQCQRHQQQEPQRQHIGQPPQPQRRHAPPRGALGRRVIVAAPKPLQRGLQLHKHPGGARDQHHKSDDRCQPPLGRRLRAGQGLAHHVGHLLAHHRLHLRDQAALQVAAVHPPAQHAHQQQQQGRQAQHAVERHGRTHAQPVGVQPHLRRTPERLHQAPQRLQGLGHAGKPGGGCRQGRGRLVHPCEPRAGARIRPSAVAASAGRRHPTSGGEGGSAQSFKGDSGGFTPGGRGASMKR